MQIPDFTISSWCPLPTHWCRKTETSLVSDSRSLLRSPDSHVPSKRKEPTVPRFAAQVIGPGFFGVGRSLGLGRGKWRAGAKRTAHHPPPVYTPVYIPRMICIYIYIHNMGPHEFRINPFGRIDEVPCKKPLSHLVVSGRISDRRVEHISSMMHDHTAHHNLVTPSSQQNVQACGNV